MWNNLMDGGTVTKRHPAVDVSTATVTIPRPIRRKKKDKTVDLRGRQPEKNVLDTVEPHSLEIQTVLKVVKEYAKRAHSLGALEGAYAIQKLVKKIRTLGPQSAALEALLKEADTSATSLKKHLFEVYEED